MVEEPQRQRGRGDCTDPVERSLGKLKDLHHVRELHVYDWASVLSDPQNEAIWTDLEPQRASPFISRLWHHTPTTPLTY